jgi:hypothetical protein
VENIFGPMRFRLIQVSLYYYVLLGVIGAPIILGLCPSLSAHESESMLLTYLVCREKQERERERERQANGTWEQHTVYY